MSKIKRMNLQIFAMKNVDQINKEKAEINTRMQQAMKEGNDEEFSKAFAEFTEILQEAVMAEAKGLIQAADNQVLSGRGVRALTSEENDYYQKVINAMKSTSPKQALADVDVVLPKTVIDAVFEDLTEEHPLLDAINFVPTGALVEILINTQDGRHLATWDALTAEIVKELTSGFEKIDLTQRKLSAFIPVGKAMLDLGPVWLDRYVRTILSEATYNGLEKTTIDGSGLNQPIGMRRNPGSALDPVNGYDELTPVVLNEITPTTYGAIVAGLLTSPNGLTRKIKEVLLLVNPVDYLTKIMPATTYRKPDGTYVNDVFPFPTKVVPSIYVPSNEAVIGIGKNYFMGLGTSKGGKIEYSDEYHFLEDERVYLTKLYGNGRPIDSTSFKILDITNLKTTVPQVLITNDPLNVAAEDPMSVIGVYDARLASLTLGSLTLSPAFNKSVMVYTAPTTNATNTINAIAMDGEATIEILNGETPVANGAAATWAEGENIVTINVTSGTETETYTVTVTKS